MGTQNEARRKAEAIMREKVMHLAMDGQISWLQASEMLGISARHMRRLRATWQRVGFSALMDQRGRVPRRKRVTSETVSGLCALRREGYREFSVQHFYEHAQIEQRFGVSYSYVLRLFQDLGLADKSEGRGRYHRKCERRPMTGMLIHLDASRHPWLGDKQPAWDLVVALDDADGRMLYARFVPEENTVSCLAALEHVLRQHGRFSALYTDRGSHFARTSQAGQRPDSEQRTQMARVCEALGIRHILAMTPQARGRSERAFGTLQGRLPQELARAAIGNYVDAQHYLDNTFMPAFNQRFTVPTELKETAFVPIDDNLDLSLLLSAQHSRVVANDHTVSFGNRKLQLPPQQHRFGFAKCKVIVHEFADASLGISHLGRLLAKFHTDGRLWTNTNHNTKHAA